MCIACNELIKVHSRRELARCFFRVQGTLVSTGIENRDLNDK